MDKSHGSPASRRISISARAVRSFARPVARFARISWRPTIRRAGCRGSGWPGPIRRRRRRARATSQACSPGVYRRVTRRRDESQTRHASVATGIKKVARGSGVAVTTTSLISHVPSVYSVKSSEPVPTKLNDPSSRVTRTPLIKTSPPPPADIAIICDAENVGQILIHRRGESELVVAH
jgi:hypothetical protein